MSTARVDFTRGAAERIARAVRIVEQGERDQTGPVWKKVDESYFSKIPFRVCTYTGTWSKNILKMVTFINVTSTPNTVVAMNLFATLPNTAATKNCAIAREGTAWYLIAAECV